MICTQGWLSSRGSSAGSGNQARMSCGVVSALSSRARWPERVPAYSQSSRKIRCRSSAALPLSARCVSRHAVAPVQATDSTRSTLMPPVKP